MADLKKATFVVSGLAGRFPAADNINELEYNLSHGIDMIDDPDNCRWPHCLWGLPGRAGRIKDLTKFDSEFFGIEKEHAHRIDHQLRILYEVVYESILDSGVNPASLRGSKTGLFLGLHTNEFDIAMHDDPRLQSSGYPSQLAVMLAKYFDFRGQVCTFDSACSSGFVALHSAMTSLKLNLIDQAIVCASNISIHPANSLVFVALRMLSPTGYSKFLDNSADGYVKSEACSAIFIQRHSEALRNYASILAINTNSDGFKREGITYPSAEAQMSLIQETKDMLQLHTNQIQYLEAHGTGTPAGDPQEARAISEVYCQVTVGDLNSTLEWQKQVECTRTIGPLLVGSIKTNMGHSEGVSGLCSLAKVILMLENDTIYKSLHYKEANKNIESLMGNRIKLANEHQSLNSKIVPINCYGFGGANVHGIFQANLKEAVTRQVPLSEQKQTDEQQQQQRDFCWILNERWRLVFMFGRTKNNVESFFDSIMTGEQTRDKTLTRDFLALVDCLCKNSIDRLMTYRGFLLVDMTSQRELYRSVRKCHLLPVVATNDDDDQTLDIGRARFHFQDSRSRGCYFVYGGFSNSDCLIHANVIKNLLNTVDIIQNTMERLNAILERDSDYDLLGKLEKTVENNQEKLSLLDRLVIITATQIALTNLLKINLKVTASSGTMGHCLNDIMCGFANDDLNEREAILLAYYEAKFLQLEFPESQQHNSMVIAFKAGIDIAQKLIDSFNKEFPKEVNCKSLYVSIVNGPDSVIISGKKEDMVEFIEYSQRFHSNEKRIHHHEILDLDYALYNPYVMNDIVETKLAKYLNEKVFQQSHSIKAAYFAGRLCHRKDFRHSLRAITDYSVLIDIGSLAYSIDDIGNNKKQLARIKLIDTDAANNSQAACKLQLFKSIGQMFLSGLRIDLAQSKLYPPCEYPVRRQVPSISSLMKWDHTDSFFVPKYPDQFSCRLAKFDIAIDISDEHFAYLLGHNIDGRVLYPATGYLCHVWRIFSNIQSGGYTLNNVEIHHQINSSDIDDLKHKLLPIEFHNVRLHRAVMLSTGLTTHLTVIVQVATGGFEIKEADSVVMDGRVGWPDANSCGLLLCKGEVFNRARGKPLNMNHSDVYRQFRLSGYDYGESFACIQSSSDDGQCARIKYNGKLVSLTDNVLQTLFLAMRCEYPVNSLFLPTGFDYMRLDPASIYSKIAHSSEKRLERSSVNENINNREDHQAMDQVETDQVNVESNDRNKNNLEDDSVIFDTFCELETGIVATDGIELRGVRASPAPRRELAQPLLECYQFVPDFEEPVYEPVADLSGNFSREQYCTVCTNFLCNILTEDDLTQPEDNSLAEIMSDNNELIDFLFKGQQTLNRNELDKYLSKHLDHRNGVRGHRQVKRQQQQDTQDSLVKNLEPFTLLTLLDSLGNVYRHQMTTDNSNYFALINSLKSALLLTLDERSSKSSSSDACSNGDLMLSTFSDERFLRPLLATIVENSCQTTNKLILFEINHGANIVVQDNFTKLLTDIQANIGIDYTLAHPNPSQLVDKLSGLSGNGVKFHTLKHIDNNETGESSSSLLTLADDGLDNVDALFYYDNSCYLPLVDTLQLDVEFKDILFMLKMIIRRRGFLIVLIRHQYSPLELFIMALRHFNMTKYDQVKKINSKQQCSDMMMMMTKMKTLINGDLIKEMARIQSHCRDRIKLLQHEAVKCCKMRLTTKKMDTTGCTMLVFQNDANKQSTRIDFSLSSTTGSTDQPTCCDNRIVHMKHGDHDNWLRQLKEQFFIIRSPTIQTEQLQDNNKNGTTTTTTTTTVKLSDYSRIWLCFVATKDNPINGIIGMMQCLIKELGSRNLRCFCDCHTFKGKLESEVRLEDIMLSKNFALALKKDMLWNCIDSSGAWGTFRHLTLNSYFLSANQQQQQQQHLAANRNGYKTEVEHAYADISTRGDLSSFDWYELPFKHLSVTERQQLISVNYSALNFRDIMLATGRLPLNAVPTKMAIMNDCLLGLEFSGLDRHRNNKRVAGMVAGRAIATHVLCGSASRHDIGAIKFDIPDSMSLKEAATIPVVYSTAIMALMCRGKMKPGESVLIHAGSGGVGQAAIRLAAYHNVKVFTTVGNEEKRQFLLKEFPNILTPSQIFNSRDCSFERQILEATNGCGVDLILNSLAEDKLQASLRCLANNGRFLEIGKYDLAMNNPLDLQHLEVNKSFHGILLDKLFEPETVTSNYRSQLNFVLETLNDGLSKGYIKPIKYTCFAKNQLEEAFRFMATGKHIGKVLIEIDKQPEEENQNMELLSFGEKSKLKAAPQTPTKAIPRFHLNPDKTYIVTGGLGGFGLELIKWLACRGAKYFAITSRWGLLNNSDHNQQTTNYRRCVLDRLKSSSSLKCEFLIITNDIADGTTLEGVELIFQMAKRMSPVQQVGGVFHLAMLLRDCLLENMTSATFNDVCRPKADSCILFDRVSRKIAPNMPSLLFVAFSSISSGRGNAGQSNYGYANSILERICEQRRKDNLHGLAIQWGPIGDVGVAYESLKSNTIALGGAVVPQRILSCLATLEKLLCSPFSVCSSTVKFTDDNHWHAHGGAKLLSTGKGGLVGAVLHVLGIKNTGAIVNDGTTLGELGLDSLMAVEIRQFIERQLEMTLNVQEVRSLTIAKIKELEQQHLHKSKKNASALAGQQSQQQQQQDDRHQVKTGSDDTIAGRVDNSEAFEKHVSDLKIMGLKFHSGFDSAFKPQLFLSKRILVPLNNFEAQNQFPSNQSNRRPVFLLTNIHGHFERLKLLVQPTDNNKINRPCFGLNWTRDLAVVGNFAEAASYYVDFLESLDWNKLLKQTTELDDDKQRVVDLMGYSFGATLSFEILLEIQRRGQKTNLLAGKLILLDMSPKLTESLGQLSGSLLESNIDEVLTFYIAHHTKHLNIDFQSIKNKLASVHGAREMKFQFACDTLSRLLNIDGTDEEKRENLLDAIVAFFRRYQVLFNYKVNGVFRGNVTLLRSKEKIFTMNNSEALGLDANDYSLSEVIDGRVDVHVFDGDHESFIDMNKDCICSLVNKLML